MTETLKYADSVAQTRTYTQLLDTVVAAATDKLCADARAKGGTPNRDRVLTAVRGFALNDWRTKMPAHFYAGYLRENPRSI